ncbi:unnamed protein product [Lampetra planeri]
MYLHVYLHVFIGPTAIQTKHSLYGRRRTVTGTFRARDIVLRLCVNPLLDEEGPHAVRVAGSTDPYLAAPVKAGGWVSCVVEKIAVTPTKRVKGLGFGCGDEALACDQVKPPQVTRVPLHVEVCGAHRATSSVCTVGTSANGAGPRRMAAA